MVRSMTGYGRTIVSTAKGNILLEIHSVNRRSLEISVHAPKEFLAFDIDVRRAISGRLRRGQVTVRINREMGDAAVGYGIDEIREIHTYWHNVAGQLGLKSEISLPFLAEQASLLPRHDFDEEAMKKALLSGLEKALDGAIAMKEEEGKALAADLEPRLGTLEKEIDAIEKLTPEAPCLLAERLQKRLEELQIADEERVARETVIFAEKSDVTEEITRFRSHIAQFRTFLEKGESIGRELDFLTQEMIRETNTIASKTPHLEMKRGALALKSGIEKIREQVQNIE